MLEAIRIQNYALVEEVEIEFSPGFNALTGETGAGKSILLGALNLVLGARASSDSVRAGAKQACVEAMFYIPSPSPRLQKLLDEHGIALDEDALLLRRVVTTEGRSRAYAGGSMIPVSVMSDLGDELVDLHGQHEHQSLLKTDRQLDLLDGYGGTLDAAREVRKLVSELRALEREMTDLETHDRERERQLEFLRFEVAEIDDAGLEPNEDVELKNTLNRATHAEQIYETAGALYARLYDSEEGAATDLLGSAVRDLEDLAELDESFAALAQQLTDAVTTVEAVATEIRGYTEEVEYNPEELNRLNQRMNLIQELKRKYGGSVEEILAYRDRASKEIEDYTQRDVRLEEMRRERERLATEANEKALALSKRRVKAGKKLDRQVSEALQDLGMQGAVFKTVRDQADLSGSGIDRIVFNLAANKGEKLKPLKQVASGGEVSRIMLALKAVFAGADAIPTLVFDEIDAGVGGAVARKVAEKIAGLAQTHQVLCITHLAQIAAVAASHFQVTKEAAGDRTISAVHPVLGKDRVAEIARLLDGSVSKVSTQHARELLAESGTKE
jgi:DNA repair protein RecN (Recombination protein N)